METWLLFLMVKAGWAQDLETLSFEQPLWLALIWLWPIFALLSGWLRRKTMVSDDLSLLTNQKPLIVKHSLISRFKPSLSVQKSQDMGALMALFELLRGLIIVFFALALANPIEKQITPNNEPIKTVRDIAFVIESSASFLLPDYQINQQLATRTEVVKKVLDGFISDLDGNRFSLTIYADNAYTMLPMTADTNLARLSLKRLKPYLAGRTDVAMGEALGLALQQADSNLSIAKVTQQNLGFKSSANSVTNNQNLTSLDSTSLKTAMPNTRRILVLISDGLSLPSRLELTEAVNYAQLLQVPIYTVGVGASSSQADKREYSGLLYQALESQSLKLIAQQTGGQYFEISNGQQMQQVLEQINQVEGVPFNMAPNRVYVNSLQSYPLYFALLFLIGYLLALHWLKHLKQKLANKPTKIAVNAERDYG